MRTNKAEQEIKGALDDSLDELSPHVQKQLEKARQAALNAAPKPWFQTPWFIWGLATSLCLAIFINIKTEHEPELASNPELGEFILLASLDETELEVIEDIEFAYWLSHQLPQQLEAEDALGVHHNG